MSDPTNNPSRLDPADSREPSPRHDLEHAPESRGATGHDPLDALLREWHTRNADRAVAGRERLLATLRSERGALAGASAPQRDPGPVTLAGAIHTFRRFSMHRYTRAAACLLLLAGLFALLVPFGDRTASADAGLVQVPDGGRLDAVDDKGNLVGPCPLKHTDVQVNIGAQFSRVKLRQTYTNPYPFKIEAVYTFPLSARGAVDHMSMTVGDRVVEGEVKERERARQIYEQARASGYVASLLEQERPNIFTQSVANIEPGATVVVEIAYVETLQSRDGEFRFDFPMVVGPRYIPGSPTSGAPRPALPAQFMPRRGVGLLGPASIALQAIEPSADGARPADAPSAELLSARLLAAVPIDAPGDAWWKDARENKVARVAAFVASYVDGAREAGELYSDGSGQLNGRWVWCPPTPAPEPLPAARPALADGGDGAAAAPGAGFSADTDQVPDASRITPMPTRPPTRAGHDVSIAVTIDSGGPKLVDVKSTLHEVATVEDSGSRRTLVLAKKNEIPNRDFLLSWRTDATEIAEQVLTDVDPRNGGFLTVVLSPPPRVVDDAVRPRELVFVLDTSGSMSGFPIEKAKAVMAKALDAMRPVDTFNLITFAGDTHVLWPEPRQATAKNRAEAQAFLASRQGRGGTEMMKAIDAALRQGAGPGGGLEPMALANLPADGRSVLVFAPYSSIEQRGDRFVLRISDGIVVPMTMGGLDLPTVLQPQGVTLRLAGTWKTVGGERVLQVREAGFAEQAIAPMRICMFLTDGYVGNDQAIVQAIREHAGTTRVFGFGIGNSVNRWLLEQMSLAGRGQSEFVTLAEESDQAVARFTARIQNPVLTDIAVRFEGVEVGEVVPGSPSTAPGLLPDLYDVEPLVLHARYRVGAAAGSQGAMVVSGNTGRGRWERRVPLNLPQERAVLRTTVGNQELAIPLGNDALPVLWARSKVEQVLAPHLQQVQEGTLDPTVRREVVALGERFSILTPYTSFVAVEKARVTLGGKPTLVPVPIELPEGLRWEGFFDESQLPMVAWRQTLLSSDEAPDGDGDTFYFGLAAAEAASGSTGDDKRVANQATARGAGARAGVALGRDVAGAPKGDVADPSSGRPSAPTGGLVAASAPPAPISASPPPPPPPPMRMSPPPPLPAAAGEPAAPPAPTALPSAAPASPSPLPTRGEVPVVRGNTQAPGAPSSGSAPSPKPARTGGEGGAAGVTDAAVDVRQLSKPQDRGGAPSVHTIERLEDGIKEKRDGGRREVLASRSLPPGGGLGFGGGGGGGFGSGDAQQRLQSSESLQFLSQHVQSMQLGWHAASPDQRAGVIGDAVMALVKPELWTVNGGAVLSGRVDQGQFLVEPMDAARSDAKVLEAIAQAIATRDLLLATTSPAATPAATAAATPATTPPTTPAAIAVQQTPVNAVPATERGATLVIYDVGDLVAAPGDGPAAIQATAALAELLASTVAPERWAAAGGDAKARVVGTALVISAPPELHERLQALLSAMRRVTSSAPKVGAVADHQGLARRERVGGVLCYDVSALGAVPGEEFAQALMLVDPPSWVTNGGSAGTVGVVGGVLVARQTAANLDAVEALLDQLHAAKGKPLPDGRRSSAAAAQQLSLPDGAPCLIGHPIDDLVQPVAAQAQIEARDAAVRISRNALRAGAATRAAGSPADQAAREQALATRAAVVADVLLVAATVAEQIELDEILQAMRDAFSLPHRRLARRENAMASSADEQARNAAERARRMERVALLHRRLDAPLFARVVELEDPSRTLVDRSKLEALLAGRDAAPAEGALAVSVLLDDVLPARLAALRKAGLSIEGENDRLKVVAGWAAPEKLSAIALAEGVRRVELAR